MAVSGISVHLSIERNSEREVKDDELSARVHLDRIADSGGDHRDSGRDRYP